jgi:hypothetical protein
MKLVINIIWSKATPHRLINFKLLTKMVTIKMLRLKRINNEFSKDMKQHGDCEIYRIFILRVILQ